MNSAAADWALLRRTAVLLAIGAFCLYLPTLFQGFFSDDDIYLSFRNRLLRDADWRSLPSLLRGQANPWEYLPLRDLSYWLDFFLFETEGPGFHASNLAWYGLSAAGAWWLFRELVRLFRPDWARHAGTLAWCGTALFLVHPAHVEAAAWVASRKDLLAAAFAFLSTAVLVRGLRHGWQLPASALAALLLLLACFGKAAALTMVLVQSALVAAAWRLSPEIPRWRKAVPLLLLWTVVITAAVVHMTTGEATGIRIENAPGAWPVLERASRIAVTLFGLLMVPHSPGLYHDVYALGHWHWAISAAGLLLVLVSVAVLLSRPALWAAGVLLAVFPWSVYLQLTPFSTWSMASERFVFVSVAGLALVLIDVAGRLSPRWTVALLLAVFLPCAMQTWARVGEWEYGSQLLALESERQPGFHNAIRDRVFDAVYVRKDYAAATQLAGLVERRYAADALRGLVAVARSYQGLGDWRNAQRRGATLAHSDFCRQLAALKHQLAVAQVAIRTEPDVSYNNLLGSIDREMKPRYSDAEVLCR